VKFKTDENLPLAAAEILRRAGHEAETVHDEQLAGEADPRLAEVCRKEGRALVTLDLDFSDIRAYPPAEYPGIVVLRPHVQQRGAILDLVAMVAGLLDKEELTGHLWVVERTGTRIRSGLPEGGKPR